MRERCPKHGVTLLLRRNKPDEVHFFAFFASGISNQLRGFGQFSDSKAIRPPIRWPKLLTPLVAGGGFEPPTFGL